jgi:pantothenate kinase
VRPRTASGTSRSSRSGAHSRAAQATSHTGEPGPATSKSISSTAAPPEKMTLPLVITEGNYLLVDEGPWAEIRGLLDEAWYVVQEEETRLRLLIARHVEFGKSPEHAREWVMRSDQRNAAVIEATRVRADALVRIGAS